MDSNKNYYVLADKKRTLVCFEMENGEAKNILECNGIDWVTADYDTRMTVEKSVKFGVMDMPAVATKITTDEQLGKEVARLVRRVLDNDDNIKY